MKKETGFLIYQGDVSKEDVLYYMRNHILKRGYVLLNEIAKFTCNEELCDNDSQLGWYDVSDAVFVYLGISISAPVFIKKCNSIQEFAIRHNLLLSISGMVDGVVLYNFLDFGRGECIVSLNRRQLTTMSEQHLDELVISQVKEKMLLTNWRTSYHGGTVDKKQTRKNAIVKFAGKTILFDFDGQIIKNVYNDKTVTMSKEECTMLIKGFSEICNAL